MIELYTFSKSDPIGAWKCYFLPFLEIFLLTDQNRLNIPTDRVIGKLHCTSHIFYHLAVRNLSRQRRGRRSRRSLAEAPWPCTTASLIRPKCLITNNKGRENKRGKDGIEGTLDGQKGYFLV